MSFLNALASDGLTVGLRFYNSRLNERNSAITACGDEEEAAVAGSSPKENDAAQVGRAAISNRRPTPEEMAAGRAEAQKMLEEQGALGALQPPTKPIEGRTSAEDKPEEAFEIPDKRLESVDRDEQKGGGVEKDGGAAKAGHDGYRLEAAYARGESAAFNGLSPGRQAVYTYAAAKYAAMNQRHVLARA
ncbi:MAG: hypothetical protein LBS31_07060 [Candidatus Adiutrix sp.]|jgi:hypothetical protein|nr:hypothetical protein [Candidatus Adiutrix sp.]